MLSGKLAVVTGGGSGIGRAICQRFANQGATVVVADLKKQEAQDTVNSLQPREFKCAPSILVNNAGITMDGLLHRMTEEQFDWVMDINLKGTFLMTQTFTEEMAKAGRPGSVINISSIVGKSGNIGQTNYAASKAGIIGLTKTVARELGPQGIRVNAVLPGFIRTPMTEKVPEKVLEGLLKQIPMRKMGEPEDIADTCVFLASDLSRYVTGACLEVTGGLGM